MGFFDPVIKQLRKPTGLLGLLMAKVMSLSHNKLTNWGLSHIQINNDYTILDIGCGERGSCMLICLGRNN